MMTVKRVSAISLKRTLFQSCFIENATLFISKNHSFFAGFFFGGGRLSPVGRAPDWSFDSSTIELETSVNNQFDFYYLKHYRTGENLTNETGALLDLRGYKSHLLNFR